MTTNGPTSLDLAALSMLSLVFTKKSFSAAAESLSTRQSTVSYCRPKSKHRLSDKGWFFGEKFRSIGINSCPISEVHRHLFVNTDGRNPRLSA